MTLDERAIQQQRKTQFRNLLTPRLRRTCALAWLDRMSFAAIASLQGIAIRTVETRIRRARRQLRAAGIRAPDGRARARRSLNFQLGYYENI
jgi:DNA-directed RNA polymerase specialized sigma24 family protein